MPSLKVYEFSWYVALCVTRSTDLYSLSAKLGLEPMELVGMINGRTSPSKDVVQGLARELDIEESFLIKLADEVRRDLSAK
jgi:transcriptional regulator with XRE-family HTH domain